MRQPIGGKPVRTEKSDERRKMQVRQPKFAISLVSSVLCKIIDIHTMSRLTSILLLLSAVLTGMHPALGQETQVTISGYIIDSGSGQPIPYATIVLKSAQNAEIITGTTSDEEGVFSVTTTASDFMVEINFMGYETMTFDQLTPKNNLIHLGKISLTPGANTLQEISVIAEQSSVEFKLDKRVFNVGKDISSTGMGALEVLNRVPSVNVDLEGEVTLRGNAGVQILINGKPSVLADERSNALSTITADMIERIEVITNPSAKYEAQGTSGIINIVLKKEDKRGLNGSMSVNTGSPANHSLGGSINYRTEKFNFFTQFGVGYRARPNYNTNENLDLLANTRLYSEGTNERNEQFYNMTLGADYYLNDRNIITLSGNYAYEIEDQPSETNFFIYDSTGTLYSSYQRTETTDATNPKWQYDLQYKREFKNHEDHVLLFSALGKFFGKDQASIFLNEYTSGPETNPNQQTTTDYYQSDFTYKLDYTNPISERVTVEAGAQYDINDVGNDYAVFNLEGSDWIPDDRLTNNFEYNQKVLGVYATGAYEEKKWGVQGGLRIENTDLQTLLTNTNQENNQNFTDYFPSLHTTYKLNNQVSFQLGYSRRISRPRLWDLNPFFNIRDNYNVRTGNPNLEPEYSDSYELTGIYIMKDATLNASVYYLYTTQVVERVTLFQDNVTVTTPVNIGTRNKTGIEVNGKYTPVRWFTLTGDINYGVFVRDGSYLEQDFDFKGDQWSMKFTTTFKLPLDIDIEITPNVQSGYETVQGEVSGYAYADVGLRKKFWKGKGVVNVGVRDVFSSRIRETIVDEPTYYVYNHSYRGRMFTLGFSYSFGKGEAMTYSGGGRR